MAKKPVDNEPEKKKEVAQAEALLREVDDAVREDDLRNFWQRYGILLSVVLVLGLGSLAGWIYPHIHSAPFMLFVSFVIVGCKLIRSLCFFKVLISSSKKAIFAFTKAFQLIILEAESL